MSKHLSEEDLTLFHYGESEERSVAARHLFSCTECRGAYDELLRLLETVGSFHVPERGPGYEAEVWEKLEGRLSQRPSLWGGMLRSQR